jgi:tRNA-uridine 2-sulfurtransferase
VTRLRPEAGEPGDIVDSAGHVLGQHSGIAHFTVGQRKGLRLAAAEPLYVLDIEAATRRIVVGPRSALGETRIRLAELNWLGAPLTSGDGVPVAAKLRSAQPPVPATLYPGTDAPGEAGGEAGGEAELVLDAPAGAVAPGQSGVLYDGERVLGGGWIRRRAAAAA